MCAERLAAGKPTACSEACPNEATVTGERDALIAIAKARMAEAPQSYAQAIYGLNEVGGTSVMMIGPVPMAELGMPGKLPTEALPVFTWRALEMIPSIVTTGGVLLSGISWITHRRTEVARAERNERKGARQ
jgi:formate dehydrogenase iron-sulfur subunit